MSSSWFLARRLLLWRPEQRKINWSVLLSVAGVAVGSGVLVLSLSILNGFEALVHGSLRRFEQELVARPTREGIDLAATITRLAEAGWQAQRYAERKLVLQADDDYRLVTARIVPDLAAEMERFGEAIIHEFSYTSQVPGILVGSLLADKLHLLPGDQVNLLSPLDISLSNPRPPRLAARVQALFEFGLLDFDDTYLLMDFSTAERLIPQLAAYSSLIIVDPPEAGPERLAELLPAEDWDISTWESEHLDLITAMRLEKLGSAFVLFLIILVAAFNATSTMVMTVMEKYREIGILRSLGASRRYVRGLFLRQGLIMGLVGVVSGLGIGGAIALSQVRWGFIPSPGGLYAEGGLPLEVRWPDFIMVGLGALLLSLAAAWYPAGRAADIEPGQAVNYLK